MSDTLLLLPILIPFITAIICILFWKHRIVQRWLNVIGGTALLAASIMLLSTVWTAGIQATQLGNWPAPFGITLVADLLSAIMVALTGLMGWATAIYSLTSMDKPREAFGYYPLLHILLMGVSGAFLTGDIFNMFVWFEVMLISSFVLLALGGERQQIEGAFKYVTINLLSSALFLSAVGILYGITGTLNMADLAQQVRTIDQPGLLTTVSMMFLVSFGIKAAVFPLFFWLPASYHTPPVAVSAIFSGLLTKVGVYALIRVFTLIFIHSPDYTHNLILIIAGFTMLTGVLGAAAQNEFRRILSFHIVSQIGYMIMGLGLYTQLALAGSVFYLAHHIIVKTNLFLISGVVDKIQGGYQLKKLGGLYAKYPFLGLLFLIPAFSLAGIPPLSGFWAKFILVKAGLEIEGYIIVATALVVSLLTIYSMVKIWTEVFWKNAPDADSPPDVSLTSEDLLPMVGPIVVLALMTVMIGLIAEPVFVISNEAAKQLLDPTEYIQAVMKQPITVMNP